MASINPYVDAAAKVLTYTKTMQPQFSTVTQEMVNGWAQIMAKTPVPVDAYVQAAQEFQVENIDGTWLSVGWLVQRAKKITDEWRHDPERSEAMRAYDQARQDERDRQIEAGTFGEARGYKPRAIEEPERDVPDFVKQQIERMKLGKRIN